MTGFFRQINYLHTSNYNLTNQICLLSKFFRETSAPILIIPKANMWPFDSWRFLNRFNNFFLAGYGQKLGICEKKLNLCMCPPCDMCMCPPISLSKFVHVSPCFFVQICACVPLFLCPYLCMCPGSHFSRQFFIPEASKGWPKASAAASWYNFTKVFDHFQTYPQEISQKKWWGILHLK